jgi:catechol-2,3-dioxygenase
MILYIFIYINYIGGKSIMKIGEVCLETNDVITLANFYRKILNITTTCNDEIHQIMYD